MKTSEPRPGERVKHVRVTEVTLSVDLADGRTITVPLAWFPRLLHATPEKRAKWKLAGAGFGIHWPEIDEDISTEGLLRGAPAPRTRRRHVDKVFPGPGRSEDLPHSRIPSVRFRVRVPCRSVAPTAAPQWAAK